MNLMTEYLNNYPVDSHEILYRHLWPPIMNDLILVKCHNYNYFWFGVIHLLEIFEQFLISVRQDIKQETSVVQGFKGTYSCMSSA